MSKQRGFSFSKILICFLVFHMLFITLPRYFDGKQKEAYSEMEMAFAPLKTAISMCAQTKECITGSGFASKKASSGTLQTLGSVALPVPQNNTSVIDASATAISASGTMVTVTLKPLATAPYGIKEGDTATMTGILNRDDNSVVYVFGGGCKAHPGGALC